MSFTLSGGAILVTKGGVTKLNTNDKLAHNLTTGINATISIASRTATGSTSIAIDTDHFVGSCDAACTEVTGSARITITIPGAGPQNYSIPVDQWFSVALGAPMWLLMDGEVGSVHAGRNFSPLQWYLYTLKLVSGSVYLRQRVRLPTVSSGTYQVPAHTVQLKLKAGLYT